METTFITIHDLSPEAHILYSSDSVVDILGYSPHEIVNRSCWDFFHPNEIPIARAAHGRGVELDKAAVLSYCQMRDKDGNWIGCEIVFTIVYDVMVGCTSIYQRGLKSQNRANEAPVIRRLFSTSPRDPRYHMLSHLSSKFSLPSKAEIHEPRAALFLNRYTRTLTIMYATNGLAEVLGITGDELRGRSFYFCIQENCLQDAIRCLENAKANDSIAYLRFWFRDPRQDDQPTREVWHDARSDPEDEEMHDVRSSDDDNDTGGVNLADHLETRRGDRDNSDSLSESQPVVSSGDEADAPSRPTMHSLGVPAALEHRTSSGDSNPRYSHEAVFGDAHHRASTASSVSHTIGSPDAQRYSQSPALPRLNVPVELEAVVSCTSDGLVVCLRRARPLPPLPMRSATQPAFQPSYVNGLFAVPWATEPMLPPIQQRPEYSQGYAFATTAGANGHNRPIPVPDKQPSTDFMNAIREIGVFAWALAGINGSMADYGRGRPSGESQPAAGLPIWRPEGTHHGHHSNTQSPNTPSENGYNGLPDGLNDRDVNTRYPRSSDPFGDPGLSSTSRRGQTYHAAPPPYVQDGKDLGNRYGGSPHSYQWQ